MSQAHLKTTTTNKLIRWGRIHKKTDGLPTPHNGRSSKHGPVTITDPMITDALLAGADPSLIRCRLEREHNVSFDAARQRVAHLGQNILASRHNVQTMPTAHVAAILAISHGYIEHPKKYIRAVVNAAEKAVQHKNTPHHKNPSSRRDQMFLLQALGLARNSSRKLDKPHRKMLASELKIRTGSHKVPYWVTRTGPDPRISARAITRPPKKH